MRLLLRRTLVQLQKAEQLNLQFTDFRGITVLNRFRSLPVSKHWGAL
jgi:hypothetical protein